MAAAVDTNILVYAHREGAPEHEVAKERIRALAVGPSPVGLPWPCVYEFLRVVTHPRICRPPSTLEDAWRFIADLLDMPTVTLLSETEGHSDVLSRLLGASKATGNLVYDAHIAALAIEHGFDEILTEDRDFHRFPGIRVLSLSS